MADDADKEFPPVSSLMMKHIRRGATGEDILFDDDMKVYYSCVNGIHRFQATAFVDGYTMELDLKTAFEQFETVCSEVATKRLGTSVEVLLGCTFEQFAARLAEVELSEGRGIIIVARVVSVEK